MDFHHVRSVSDPFTDNILSSLRSYSRSETEFCFFRNEVFPGPPASGVVLWLSAAPNICYTICRSGHPAATNVCDWQFDASAKWFERRGVLGAHNEISAAIFASIPISEILSDLDHTIPRNDMAIV